MKAREIRIKGTEGSDSLLRSLDGYLQHCGFSDALIVCGDGSLVGAHRPVLAAVSPFLRRIFLNATAAAAAPGQRCDDVTCLSLPDTGTEAFNVFMELAYRGHVTFDGDLRPAVVDLLATLQVTDQVREVAVPNTEAPEEDEEDRYPATRALPAVFGSCSLVKVDNQKAIKHEPGDDAWDGGIGGVVVEEFLEEVSMDDGVQRIISSKQKNRERSSVKEEAAEEPLPLPSSPTAPVAHRGFVPHSLSLLSGLATSGEAPKKRKKTVTVEFLSAKQPLPLPQISSLAKVAPKVEVTESKGPLKGAATAGAPSSGNFAIKSSLVSIAPVAAGIAYTNPSDMPLSVPYVNGVIPDKDEADRITREVLQPCTDMPEFRKSRNNQVRCICPSCTFYGKGGGDQADSKVPPYLRQGYTHVCHYPDCGKRYKKTSHLRAHLRLHVGMQPFLCSWPSCDRKFTRSDELHRHFRIHTGEKNHKCSSCEKTFARSDHLKKHILTHSSSWGQNAEAAAVANNTGEAGEQLRVKMENTSDGCAHFAYSN